MQQTIATADDWNLTIVGTSLGGVQFLQRMEGRFSDPDVSEMEIVSSVEKECSAILKGEQRSSSIVSIPSCAKTLPSIINLLTLHYICQESNSLLYSERGVPSSCSLAISEIGRDDSGLPDVAIALAALTKDLAVLDFQPWQFGLEERFATMKAVDTRAQARFSERFDAFVVAARTARSKVAAWRLSKLGSGVSVDLVVGNIENSRILSAADELAGIIDRNGFGFSVETVKFTASEFSGAFCELPENSKSIVLFDATTFASYQSRKCFDRVALPAGRIAREDLHIWTNVLSGVGIEGFDAVHYGKVDEDKELVIAVARGATGGWPSADRMVIENFGFLLPWGFRIVEFESGSLAARAVSDGRADVTMVNAFEAENNIDDAKAAPIIAISPNDGVQYFDTSVFAEVYESDAKGLGLAGNLSVGLVGDWSNQERAIWSDALKAVVGSEEWTSFLAEKSLTATDISVNSGEFADISSFLRP
ncbi:MAG: hypothetical protein AAF526_01785 [Pseudomonadota bacterium]